MTEEEELYSLDLHESMIVAETIEVIRVPGGWIYFADILSDTIGISAFVPYNDEYAPPRKVRRGISDD